MNYAFFGTPRFAEIVLEKLIEGGMPPSLVVTNPNRPTGRKHVLTPPPAKVVAERHHIPLLQPETLLNLKSEIGKPDFAILASYGKIIPREIIDLFPKGIIVVHGSLLPKYRGATPIQTALLNGDTTTGITLLLMDEKVDHGKMLSSSALPISSDDTYTSLIEKLANLSADLLFKTVPEYLAGRIIPREQNHTEATFTKKFQTENGLVNWSDLKEAEEQRGVKAKTIDRMIRALNPDPGVYTLKENKRIKLLEARIENDKLKLTKIQEEGKKAKEV